MLLSTQPYKGTRDFYPKDQRIQTYIFNKMRHVVEGYGYQEYNGPMLEAFELYAAKSGEELVNQQLYAFTDRGERKVAIRPEMTPTLARMVAGKIMELPRPVRWFSIPNLWRYERPQRGRLREHWQLNVDLLGGERGLADVEILQVAFSIVKAFGGAGKTEIRVNNRRLVDHLFQRVLGFSGEVALKISKAVDARAKIGEEKYATWLKDLGVTPDAQKAMEEFFHADFETVKRQWPCEGVDELVALFAGLKEAGVTSGVVFDPMVLRGLDYYTGTVFEMYDTSPENRRAMFGGGRYDNLVGMFSKESLSGVGFGWGDVTMRDFLETHKLVPAFEFPVDAFVTMPTLALRPTTETIAAQLREQGLKVVTPLGEGGFGAQLKAATKHEARVAVLLGDDELKAGKVAVKDLKTGAQEVVEISKCADVVRRLVQS